MLKVRIGRRNWRKEYNWKGMELEEEWKSVRRWGLRGLLLQL